MLQNIRDKAQGWIAYGIVALISVPFALWGIQEYLGLNSEPVAAKVNGEEITVRELGNRFQDYREQLRQQLGGAYSPEMFDDKAMRKGMLDRLVSELLIKQVSHDMGLRVSDVQVMSAMKDVEAFQKDGRLDQEAIKRVARLQGLTPAGLMERMRQDLLTQQLAQAVSVSTFVTGHEKAETQRLLNQRRKFSYFVVPAADFRVETPIGDEEINAYYRDNQAEFAVPERVKLSYLQLDVESAGDSIKVTDEELQRHYEGNQDKFGRPEQRKASHILLQVPRDADEKTVTDAKAGIEALAKRLAAGEDFATLAEANSQDPVSAAKGGDLGYFSKGDMDAAFEAAAFALEPGQISEPVRSNFGFHLIKLVDVKPGGVPPLEQIRPRVEQSLRREEGERRYFEMAERLADLSFDEPASLEPAAEDLGLTIQHSGWVTRGQGEGVLGSPKALTAAFSDYVLVEGNNSELIELDTDASLVLRVDDHKEASTRTLDEVREQIVEKLRRQHAETQAQAEADKRKQEIRSGTPLPQAAGNFPVTGPLSVKRSDRSAPAELVSALFSSAKPAPGEATVDSIRLANGDVAVYALQAVEEGSAGGEAEANMLQRRLNGEMQQALITELVADLKSRADIEILLQQSEEE